MIDIKKQIPSYSIIRRDYRGRYICVDPYLSGKTRFGTIEGGDDEKVFKGANRGKLSEAVVIGSTELILDREIQDVCSGCYVQIGNAFYECYGSDSKILSVDSIQEEYDEGTPVFLNSVPITASREQECLSVAFGETVLVIEGNRYEIAKDTAIEDAVAYFQKFLPCSSSDGMMYFIGNGYSTNTEYQLNDSIPFAARMLYVQSKHPIGNGDTLVMFDSDIREDHEATVESAFEEEYWSGYAYYVILTDEQREDFDNAQLKANPAYFSKKLDTGSAGPFIPDICFGTTFGDKTTITKGFRLYTNDTCKALLFSDMEYVAHKKTYPSDLWLTRVTYGSVMPELPSLYLKCDSDGKFQMYIDSPITELFQFQFSCPDSSGIVSVMDRDGNVLHTGNINDSFTASINNTIITISASANTKVLFKTFIINSYVTSALDYYFIVNQNNNSRTEVNGLHLNRIFKSYKELLAVIGEGSRAGEGRIAI